MFKTKALAILVLGEFAVKYLAANYYFIDASSLVNYILSLGLKVSVFVIVLLTMHTIMVFKWKTIGLYLLMPMLLVGGAVLLEIDDVAKIVSRYTIQSPIYYVVLYFLSVHYHSEDSSSES